MGAGEAGGRTRKAALLIAAGLAMGVLGYYVGQWLAGAW